MVAFVKILVAAVIIVGLSFMAIAIKMFIQKNGEFKKTCSSIDPKTGKTVHCSCGAGEPANCHNK
ncbi:MAG: hypothetical protein WBJ84_07040 [Bacteroidales bacterium]